MTSPDIGVAAHQPTMTRRWWQAPRTIGGTLTLFVIGYLVWQPFAAAVLPLLVGTPRMQSRAAWQVFLLVLPLLGVIGGALWWLSAQRPRGALRYWLRSTSRMLALATMLTAARVGTMPLALWCVVVLGTAALMGALWGWMERWETAVELDHRRPNVR